VPKLALQSVKTKQSNVKKLCTQHKYDLAIGASEIPEACVGNISTAGLWLES